MGNRSWNVEVGGWNAIRHDSGRKVCNVGRVSVEVVMSKWTRRLE